MEWLNIKKDGKKTLTKKAIEKTNIFTISKTIFKLE